MTRAAALAMLTLLAACETMEPSGDPFKPVQPKAASTAAAASVGSTAEPVGPQGGFDFEAQGRDDEGSADSDPDLEDLYAGLGIEKSPEGEDEEAAEPVAPVAPPQPIDRPAALPAAPVKQPWQPGVAIPGSWGVRLVSTVSDAQPPRAILGMPDGSEQVVQPGTLLPSVGVVVLAVGQDAVQVAEIVPDGDRAKVSSYVLTALYPSGPE